MHIPIRGGVRVRLGAGVGDRAGGWVWACGWLSGREYAKVCTLICKGATVCILTTVSDLTHAVVVQ